RKPAPMYATPLEAALQFPAQPGSRGAPRSCYRPFGLGARRRARRVVGVLFQQWETESLTTGVVSLRNLTCQGAYAQDVALALSDRNRPARIEQIECVGSLEHLLVRRQRQLGRQQLLTHLLVVFEVAQQHGHIRQLEVVDGLLD